jgi:hypothetical protein
MFSEKEKQEMKEMGASKRVRDEFRQLRKQSLQHQPLNLDHFIQFLTAMSRLNPQRVRPRTFVEYTQVKL